MTRAFLARGALGALLALVAIFAACRLLERDAHPAAASTPAIPSAAPAAEETEPAPATFQGFIYGRVTTIDGAIHEGRLRWGGDEEASWGDYFNGERDANPWLAQVPPERIPMERHAIRIFGLTIADRETPSDVTRFFMARFGDIARVEAHPREVWVTLKSGSVFVLGRFAASDFDDGVRVWDSGGGIVDLDGLRIRTIELLPTRSFAAAPSRLYATVRTRGGDFTGFVQWDREKGLATDELAGRTAESKPGLRFETVRAIARRSPDSSLVTLDDGREILLSGDDGQAKRGIYVDDRRYGRVLVSWDAFERVDFSRPGQGEGVSGPAYGDFLPGSPLTGCVTTRDKRRLIGRLVFDLDESETTETLDAPAHGVDYTIPFRMVTAIDPAGRVTLQSGEQLELERTGDLGDGNAGMLIFVDGRPRPEYVPWTEVERVDFERPPAVYRVPEP